MTTVTPPMRPGLGEAVRALARALRPPARTRRARRTAVTRAHVALIRARTRWVQARAVVIRARRRLDQAQRVVARARRQLALAQADARGAGQRPLASRAKRPTRFTVLTGGKGR